MAKGVSRDRLTTISYGKDRPTALGDDEQAWAQNRNAISSCSLRRIKKGQGLCPWTPRRPEAWGPGLVVQGGAPAFLPFN